MVKIKITMAKIELQQTLIEIEIPDIIFGETILKRKARFINLNYSQQLCFVAIAWHVFYFANTPSGEYGEQITAPGIGSFYKESVADNTTIVDIQTGAILTPDENGEYSGNYCGQYDWFNMVAESQNINVHAMVRAYGLQANW